MSQSCFLEFFLRILLYYSVSCMGCGKVDTVAERQSLQDSSETESHHSDFLQRREFVSRDRGDVYQIYDFKQIIAASQDSTVRSVVHKTSLKRLICKVIPFQTHNYSFTQVQILRMLDHPNIVRISQFFMDAKSNVYIIFQEIRAVSIVTNWVQQHNPSFKTRLGLIKQILSAVAYCHQLDIAHRALQFDNILLTGTDMPIIKLLGFGYSAITGCPHPKKIDTNNELPEIKDPAQRKELSQKDIWDCAIVFYQMLFTQKLLSNCPEEIVQLLPTKIKALDLDQETSSSLQSLLSSMVSTKSRPTAHQCLQNPLFSKCLAEANPKKLRFEKEIDQKLIQRTLSPMSELGQLNQILWAYSSAHTQVPTEIMIQFINRDGNYDGKISKNELMEASMSLFSLSRQSASTLLMKNLQSDKESISYSQFVFLMNLIMGKDEMEETFREIDGDNKGVIKKNQLRKFFKTTKGTFWKKIPDTFTLEQFKSIPASGMQAQHQKQQEQDQSA